MTSSGLRRRCSSEQRNRCLAASFDVLSARLVSQGPSERGLPREPHLTPPTVLRITSKSGRPTSLHWSRTRPQSRGRLLLADVADRSSAITHEEEPRAPPARSLRDERDHRAADRGVIATDGTRSRGVGHRDDSFSSRAGVQRTIAMATKHLSVSVRLRTRADDRIRPGGGARRAAGTIVPGRTRSPRRGSRGDRNRRRALARQRKTA
jgi:hypothetical protein